MSPVSLTSVLHQLRPSAVRQQPLLHDNISVVTLGLSILFNCVTVVLLLVKVHHVDYPVPTQYLSLVGFDQVGAWYAAYRLAAFGLAVTFVNGLLAAQSFKRNRVASFLLLVGAVAVSVLCCVISLAFAAIT